MIRLTIVHHLEDHDPATGYGVPVGSPYVRDNWLPLIGPTSYLLLTSIDGQPCGHHLRDRHLWATALGVKAPVLGHSFGRLRRFGLAHGTTDDAITLPLMVRTLRPHEHRRARPDLPQIQEATR